MAEECAVMRVFNLHERAERRFREMDEMAERLKHHADPMVQLAAMAEARRHVEMATRTMDTALQMDAVRDFAAAVVEALAEESDVVRRHRG